MNDTTNRDDAEPKRQKRRLAIYSYRRSMKSEIPWAGTSRTKDTFEILRGGVGREEAMRASPNRFATFRAPSSHHGTATLLDS